MSDFISMHYEDSADELCSLAILSELKVVVDRAPVGGSDKQPHKNIYRTQTSTAEEHCSSGPVYVICGRNKSSFEFRDSADCWIKVTLNADDTITFPPGMFRKYSSASTSSFSDAPDCVLKPRFLVPGDAIQVVKYHSYRDLVCELCRQFFTQGWVTGTGGSISIRYGNRIYMTPSGVQKERIQPDELFVLDTAGTILSSPARKPGSPRPPKLSDCSPLFLHAFVQRNAGAVLHSHSFCCNIITSIFDGKSEVRISNQEMIKGIQGCGYYDELVVPIIENTAHEHELSDALGETIAKYPKAFAVLVRRHGMYVWGDSWEQAKRHGECYHYLFELVIQMKQLGMDFLKPPVLAAFGNSSSSRSKKYKHYLFDIEGTTTPITFVKDVLFPYASANVEDHLLRSWETTETKQDVALLNKEWDLDREQRDWYSDDRSKEVIDAWGAYLESQSRKEKFIDFLVKYVRYSIQKDKKSTALKQLQGHIWKRGYESGSLRSSVYDDVSPFWNSIVEGGAKLSIYSSGSREAQSLLFKYTPEGDLRRFISCYFDTKIGGKREAGSYDEIVLHLGVDNPDEILFVTDILEEAQAAAAAGLNAVISVRPGNTPLPEGHGFDTVSSFAQLL